MTIFKKLFKKFRPKYRPENGQTYKYTHEGNAYDGYVGKCIVENGFISLFSGTSYLIVNSKSFKYLIKI